MSSDDVGMIGLGLCGLLFITAVVTVQIDSCLWRQDVVAHGCAEWKLDANENATFEWVECGK